MVFSNFTRTTSGNQIIFKNKLPIKNVGSLKFYKDNSSGSFATKKFRWSFDNNYWSSWETLNQANLTNIDVKGNDYLFIEIRYKISGSGKVTTFSVNYTLAAAIDPCETTTSTPEQITIDTIEDYTSKVRKETINADFLNSQNGSYYLWRPNHKGPIPQSVVTNLTKDLNILDSKIGLFDASVILGATNIGDGSANIYSDISTNILRFRSLSGTQATKISQIGDVVYIGIDASFSGGEINNGDNLGIGASIWAYKDPATKTLEFRSLSSINDIILITSDDDNIYIDVSIFTEYVREASLGDSFVWNTGVLDISIASSAIGMNEGIGDVSIYDKKIDASLYFRSIKSTDNIIASYEDGQTIRFDVSVFTEYVKEASLGDAFVWDTSGFLDVSITAGDPSFNDLYALIQDVSINVGGLVYDSSIFINTGDDHALSLSNLDSILSLLAPEKPNLLSGTTLLLTNSLVYTGILPSGLSSEWYNDGKIAGDTITDYSIDNIFKLTSPSYSDTFRAGKWSDTTTRGILYGILDGVTDVSYNMIPGTGSNSFSTARTIGTLRFNQEAGYGGISSDFWRRAQAYINVTAQQDGYVSYAIKHSESLTSNTYSLRYDNNPGGATFNIDPSYNEESVNIVYLSGIGYFGVNSVVKILFEASTGIFQKTYHPSYVARVTSTYGTPINVNPFSVPVFSDTFDTSTNFTFNYANKISGANNATITTTLYKPNVIGSSNILTLRRRLNTYSVTRATSTIEYFTDEYRRILIGGEGAADTPWDSEDISIFITDTSVAQVRNGILQYPVDDDYGIIFSGTDKEYLRRFSKTSGGLSSGTLSFTGFSPDVDISTYGVGSINMLIWLTDQNKYYDLGQEFGTGGDGTSRVNAKGGFTSLTSSGIAYSLGTDSMGNETEHNSEFVLIIIFRNDEKTIEQITTT